MNTKQAAKEFGRLGAQTQSFDCTLRFNMGKSEQ